MLYFENSNYKLVTYFTKGSLESHCTLPAQHQTARRHSYRRAAEHSAAKGTDVFLRSLLDTKTELKGEYWT